MWQDVLEIMELEEMIKLQSVWRTDLNTFTYRLQRFIWELWPCQSVIPTRNVRFYP